MVVSGVQDFQLRRMSIKKAFTFEKLLYHILPSKQKEGE